MGLVQEVSSLMQVPTPGQVRVHRFVLVDILTVIDGSFLDFVDGVVDFFDRVLLFDVDGAAVRTVLEMGPSFPQIGERMDVRRMMALRVDILGRQREQESNGRRDQGNSGQSLHADYHLV